MCVYQYICDVQPSFVHHLALPLLHLLEAAQAVVVGR